MNKDELKGKAERLKGRLKEASGVITGNKEKRAEGMGEQITGTAREKLGKLEDALAPKHAADDDDDRK